MKDIYRRFEEFLIERLTPNIQTTEDSVRYTFFHAVCSVRRIPPHKVILEKEHSSDKGARIDALIELGKNSQIAVEFKYHRRMRSGSGRPRPQQAGTLIADMGRLARFSPASSRLLVYLTDKEMSDYLGKPEHGMSAIFEGTARSIRLTSRLFAATSTTFKKAAGKSIQGEVTCVFKSTFADSYNLRIWEVTP